MADLHTHILPGLDDGARTAQDAVQLLKLQAEEGVTAVALTPHFSFGRCGVDVFCEQRQKAFERLQGAAAGLPGCPRLLLGAEVAFSPRVLDEDMRPLCLGGGDAMLL